MNKGDFVCGCNWEVGENVVISNWRYRREKYRTHFRQRIHIFMNARIGSNGWGIQQICFIDM